MQNSSTFTTIQRAISSHKLTLALAGCAILSTFPVMATTIDANDFTPAALDGAGNTEASKGLINVAAASGVTDSVTTLGFDSFAPKDSAAAAATAANVGIDSAAPDAAVPDAAVGATFAPPPTDLIPAASASPNGASLSATPEPSTFVLFGAGIAALVARKRKAA